MTRKSLNLKGDEIISITGVEAGITPGMDIKLTIQRADGKTEEHKLKCRIDTVDEVGYYLNGGVLNYVLRDLASQA
jgi:aconitate hydratase